MHYLGRRTPWSWEAVATPKQSLHSQARASHGLTLVEVAIFLLLVGLLMMGVLRAEQLIENARVRKAIAQQDAVEQAVLVFEDRFHALPGDYDRASEYIDCGGSTCLNGNGNGRVEPGTGGAIHEEILVWHQLSAAGLLLDHYEMRNPSDASPAPSNTPVNAFGGYLQFAFDSNWGISTNTAQRHNLKTGNYVAAAVLAGIDRKIDDGLPGSGRFQFSTYAGAGTPPAVGGTASGCADADSAAGRWLERDGSDNCGAAILLR
jgi:hypothetical protein